MVGVRMQVEESSATVDTLEGRNVKLPVFLICFEQVNTSSSYAVLSKWYVRRSVAQLVG